MGSSSSEKRGSIAFFPTYRPPVALDIYSCPMDPPPKSKQDELLYMTSDDDRHSYNYNAQVIPPAAPKKLLKRPVFTIYKEADVDSGRLSGLIFVSERGDVQLETLHIALRFTNDPKAKVFGLADVFGTSEFQGVRLEDSGCFAGDYLIYVTTRDPSPHRRVADLSPAVSPSGKMIAVASFEEKKGGWDGEIENLKTNIFVMNVEEDQEPLERKADISKCLTSKNPLVTTDTPRVLPDDPKAVEIDARTPAAISDTKVARIGYHRCKSDTIKVQWRRSPRQFHKLGSPYPDVGAFRVSGVFPTFSSDGSKLAFVYNEFKAVWVADDKGLRVVHSTKVNNFFSPVWNQNPDKDTLCICVGPAFSAKESLHICAIKNVSKRRQQRKTITKEANNAFSLSNPDGTKLVFRSTRDYPGHEKRHKNLYIMEDANLGDYGDSEEPTRRLTKGEWTDTHCQWSPKEDWIVFSSTRDKPEDSPPDDNGLEPGYFAVYLVKWNDPNVVVRVLTSGDNIAGHVNHPFFSPDGKSIVVTADLAAVSADPVSLPLFVHSVRPYGDIFTVDIDPKDIKKNENVKNFTRITHSRYESLTECGKLLPSAIEVSSSP
ncbi:hypothetical protein TIFTF001_022654 [Ficus carica]|uniref:Uncharacterized protein n=1 Tax=Ficus carica TaxID=3494 RepID=A0AA88AJJ3_FICCA|nr:hypothetical protein TIFTF001_022654 [Ficus carica]